MPKSTKGTWKWVAVEVAADGTMPKVHHVPVVGYHESMRWQTFCERLTDTPSKLLRQTALTGKRPIAKFMVDPLSLFERMEKESPLFANTPVVQHESMAAFFETAKYKDRKMPGGFHWLL